MTWVQLHLVSVQVEQLQSLAVGAQEDKSALSRYESHVDYLIKVQAKRPGLLQRDSSAQRALAQLLFFEIIDEQVLVHVDSNQLAKWIVFRLTVLKDHSLACDEVLLEEARLHRR